MNQIPHKQNQPEYLQLLAAQRYLYNQEKKWLVIIGSIAFIVAVLGTGVLPAMDDIQPYIVVAAIAIFSAEFGALKFIQRYRVQAASIQELFDTDLFELPTNKWLESDRPSDEQIEKAARQFRQKEGEEGIQALKNWYSVNLEGLPLHQARVLCQRSNIYWDSQQRRLYSRMIYGVSFLLVIIPVMVAIFMGMGAGDLFTGPVLFALPLVFLLFRHAYQHSGAADRLDALNQQVDELKIKALDQGADPSIMMHESRQLQNRIFDHRRNSLPVFSWFYNKLKSDLETTTDNTIASVAGK